MPGSSSEVASGLEAGAPRSGFSLFRVGGVEIRLDYSWFALFVLILASLSLGYFPRTQPGHGAAGYWAAGLAATVCFFLSLLAHELSHAFVARRSGVRVPAITLFLFGGFSHLEREATDPAREFRIAAVGPLTSFALAAGFWGLHRALAPAAPSLAASVVLYLAWINAALGVFNLLPGFPLDGGRMLRALAWWRTGSLRRATRLASGVGKGLALGVVLLGVVQIFAGALLGGVWLVLIGMFLRGLAASSYENLVLWQTLEDVRVGDVAIERPVTVPPSLSIQALVDEYLLERGFRAYPVVEHGRPIGLVSLDDLKGLPADERASTTVRERMRPADEAMRVGSEEPLAEALPKLGGAPGGRLLVLRGGELAGILTKSALHRFVEIRHVLQEPQGA